MTDATLQTSSSRLKIRPFSLKQSRADSEPLVPKWFDPSAAEQYLPKKSWTFDGLPPSQKDHCC